VLEKGHETTKTEWVKNIDVRESFIKARGGGDYQKGEEALITLGEKDSKYKKLRIIPIPDGYKWIFSQFLEIWRGCEFDMSGHVIFTFQTINEYVECMKVPLTVEDKKMIFKMKAWAMNQIFELEKEEE
jgi:hypothetical protein